MWKRGRRQEVGFPIIKVYKNGNWKHEIQVKGAALFVYVKIYNFYGMLYDLDAILQ